MGSRSSSSGDADTVIRKIATRQHGVVARRQLLKAGLSARVIDYRIAKSRLRRLHSGVYGVGPVPTLHEREMAAVLACGQTAVLSGRSAAALWQIVPPPTNRARVDVTVRRGNPRPGGNVCVHRTLRLLEDEWKLLHGIPTTTPARTIVDLAAIEGARELERAVAQAERMGLISIAQLSRRLERHVGRAGVRVLREVLGLEGGPAFLKSKAEEIFLRLMRDAGLTMPEVNAVFAGKERDFLWRRERLVVEIDGFAFHRTRQKFEDDRSRDKDLVKANVRVMRVTWKDLTTTPLAVVADVARALTPFQVR